MSTLYQVLLQGVNTRWLMRWLALVWCVKMWRKHPRFKGLTVDHIVPENRGGVTCLGNSQILPMKVNVNKSDDTYDYLFTDRREAKNLAGKLYLEYTGGLVCEPCGYDCNECPFGQVLSDLAMEYSAWVPEDTKKPL